MSAATSTISARGEQPSFLATTIGKKVVMAATGMILFGFVTGHMLGNLQIYLGPEKLDAYAHFLQSNLGLLWGARTVLLLCVILHITMAVQLASLKAKARPVAYQKKTNAGSTYASRTMLWSGPILLAFIIYHLLHFTIGSAHPDFRQGSVYHNVVSGFQQPAPAIAYIVAMAMLGMHLYHGVWSMFQSVGVSHPRYTPMLKRFALLATVAIVAGNISIPISILLGLVY
jgi:succinate dehydrogenase / fumarate reductase cytochrome b subunit